MVPRARAQTIPFDDGILAIDAEPSRSMQDASYLIIDSGRAAFVATGTNGSVALPLEADIALNTKGLQSWLKRLRKAR